ncbi:MAG: permease, partial [Campylobacterales bacterium]|nr:permease [Campylobacterales bacterium]
MEYIHLFFNNLLVLANAMSLFILIGLLIAGILKEILPKDYIKSKLGNNTFSSVLKATLLGIPMPVCSCSVIPLAKSLQKEGASKGAVQSFLISTPITGVDSIMATYSFFGPLFTFYRVVTSVITAILTGVLQNILSIKEEKPQFSVAKPTVHETVSSCCSGGSCSSTVETDHSFSMKRALTYGYVTLFEDIAKSLFIGLILGALFTTFLPKELLSQLFENQFLTYFAVLVIAMPLYVCATASLPIAAAFMLSGMSGGAAFIFLS